MTTKSKQLVRAGHELASELKANCGAVDMRSVANLLTELASALDVQSARSDALAAKLNDVCAENAALKSGGNKMLGEACAVYAKLNKLIDPEIGDFIDGQTLHEFQFLLDTGTTNTDAWVNEQRDAILDAAFAAAKQEVERRFGRTFQDCAWLARRNSDTQMKGAVEMAEWVELYAAQLRGGQV